MHEDALATDIELIQRLVVLMRVSPAAHVAVLYLLGMEGTSEELASARILVAPPEAADSTTASRVAVAFGSGPDRQVSASRAHRQLGRPVARIEYGSELVLDSVHQRLTGTLVASSTVQPQSGTFEGRRLRPDELVISAGDVLARLANAQPG